MLLSAVLHESLTMADVQVQRMESSSLPLSELPQWPELTTVANLVEEPKEGGDWTPCSLDIDVDVASKEDFEEPKELEAPPVQQAPIPANGGIADSIGNTPPASSDPATQPVEEESIAEVVEGALSEGPPHLTPYEDCCSGGYPSDTPPSLSLYEAPTFMPCNGTLETSSGIPSSPVSQDPLQLPMESQPSEEKLTISPYEERYFFRRPLGAGGQGDVYLFYDSVDRQEVVAKWIRKDKLLQGPDDTIPNEAKMLFHLREDPGVVTFLKYCEVEDYCVILMKKDPKMDSTLFEIIRDYKGRLPEDMVARLILQVAETLKRLHDKYRVLHGDIKPANLIVDDQGNVKLIDFGTAAFMDGKSRPAFHGTLGFRSPEACQERGRENPDGLYLSTGPESEVWALGVTLYNAIFKTFPFKTEKETCNPGQRVKFPKSSSANLKQLLRGMLAKDISCRFTIDEVIASPWIRKHTQPTSPT